MSEAAAASYRWRIGIEGRVLVVLMWVLLTIGLATVYSASSITADQMGRGHAYFLIRQLTGVIAGLVVFAVAAKVDADRWYGWAWPLMILSLVLLTIVILPGTESIAPRINGSRRFLKGGSFQPSELGKLAVILWTSMLLVKKGDLMRRLTKGLLPFLIVLMALNLLVALEPDLSVALMYTLIMGIVLFAGGVRIGHFVALLILVIPAAWQQIERLNYVLLRMVTFFDPGSVPSETSYQQTQSLIAVGSGGALGVGFGEGRQQYGFLPYAYDDFIAGNIGEEWGFLGLVVVVLAFVLYGVLGFRIARLARSPFQKLVALGLTATVIITAYLHIAVSIGLLPTTGLTLPFISYGRSNLVITMLMTGILVNIASTREKVIGAAATDPLAPVPA
ncbi:MAG TPA: putative peptidoglycan glycosyltransferase FtsW [Gemmatimonadaceae bacterium]|nr:putative peptidoglycan glycosyltransferase FtsW [Gemmatimonadaceae bacterium]